MAKVITTEERFAKARALMQKARDIPASTDGGWGLLSYAAEVKDTLRQAHDLLKFLPQTAGVSTEQKTEARELMQEIAAAEKSILHKS